MTPTQARLLILACGNTLRGDDGVGPWLAEWAAIKFHSDPDVRVLAWQQWTPELAEEIAKVESVLFIDSSAESAPGALRVLPIEPAVSASPGLQTHHLGAAELLALARDLYDFLPRQAVLLTIGAGQMEVSEGFSDPVKAALPDACNKLEETVLSLLNGPEIF